MEETELEEGEACYYQSEDGDSAIDPDIALSYIDEKLQDVLGHFQKDFEGGVSAENLGAKFGGYGSFLPTYQQSPSWSRPRTPPEGGQQNSVSSSSGSLSARPATASLNAIPVLRPPSGNDLVNQDVPVLSNHGQEMTSKFEFQKPTNLPDQKTLKFRIKVGTESLSTHKNAEIYSGLGLDVSPSSLDDSPTDSEGLYLDHQGIPHESPTSILQIMTSVALFRSLLLSPLSNQMIQLNEKEWDWGKSKSKTVHKGDHGDSRSVVNRSDLSMINEKVLGEKKQKLLEKSSSPVETLNSNNKDICNGGAFKKETDIDTSACEELVSNTLKLPLLSNSYHDVDLAKDSKTSVAHSKAAVKSLVKNDAFSDVAVEEPSEPVVYLENGEAEKFDRKGDSSGKVWEGRKPNYADGNSVYKKENDRKDEKSDFSIKSQSHVSEEKKSLNVEVTDTSKQKVVQKVNSHNEDGLKLVSGGLRLSSGNKKKSEGSQSILDQGMEFQEDGSVISSSIVRKSKSSNLVASKSESESLKKVDGKATERYREFFGELELEQEDDEIASEEMPLPQRSKGSELVERKSMFESNSIFKERPTSKKTEEQYVPRDHPRLSSNVPRPGGKVPNPDAASVMVAPLVKEDWVCCDRCQTWRLLPLGTNPESLPEKWHCSMLDWLPGMNNCSVSEEQTTNALRARYQVQASAASESQHNQHAPPGRTLLGGPTGDARSSENSGLQVTASGGKKKYGPKDVVNATDQDSIIRVPNPKNLQECTRNRSSHEANHSPSVDEFGYQQLGQHNDSIVERCSKENKKKNLVDHYSDEGDIMKSKMKNKRENDVDGPRASKKMKTDDVLLKDENCSSDHAVSFSKAGRSSNSGLSNSTSGKDPDNYSSRSRDSKGYLKKKLAVSSEKPEVQMSITSEDGSLQVGKCENGDSGKKRKVNENKISNANNGTLPSTGHHSQGSRGLLEESLENGNRKEKKARVSKSDGKDSNNNKDNIINEKKAAIGAMDQKKGQDIGSTPSQRSIDAADSLRRDLGSLQPSAAATSSSSKVSGSRRSKASRPEMKGSPVESVSSSPLKISNTDKFSQAKRNVGAKDDLHDAGFFLSSSPRRSLVGDDIAGGDLSGKMNDTLNVIHNGSLESSVLDFQGRDLGHISSSKAKAECTASPYFAAQHVPDSNINPLDQGNQRACQTEVSEQSHDERRRNENQYLSNGSHSKKSGTRSKEKIRGSRPEFDNGRIMLADSIHESSYEEKMKAGRNKFQEKSGISSGRVEKNYVSKKDSAGKLTSKNCKDESPSKIGSHEGPVARQDVISVQDVRQKILPDSDNERSSRKPLPEKTGIEVSGRGKSHSLQPSVGGQSETTHLLPIAESKKENGENSCGYDDLSKALKQTKKSEKQNGNQSTSMRNLTTSTHKGRDIDAPSPARRDSSSQAVNNAVKEAKDLKHLADRLKNSGSTESTSLYFQAALKFLHGASMLESSGSENAKHSEMIQSMQMYSSTAKLCEFCAHEYEKSKDMAAAALAYKCTEVAYMRVIYTSHTSANRDRNELQTALQIIPPGESPSSSASDIDNLNNPMTADKAVVPKGVGSPQVTGSQVLTARNRSSFMRLMNFAHNVSFAMEASRKSRTRLGEVQNREGLSSVRRALDFNFQDVDGLLRLVRVAMEAINR